MVVDDYLSALMKKDIDNGDAGTADAPAQPLATPVCLSPCSLQVDNPQVVLCKIAGKAKATLEKHSPQPTSSDCTLAGSTTFANWGLQATRMTPLYPCSFGVKRSITFSSSDSPSNWSSSSGLTGDSPLTATSSVEDSNSSASFTTVFTSPLSVNSKHMPRIEHDLDQMSLCESVHAKRIDFSDLDLVSQRCNSEVQPQQSLSKGKSVKGNHIGAVSTKPSPDCVLDDSWLSPGPTPTTAVEKKQVTSLIGSGKASLSFADDESEQSEVQKLIITTAEKASVDFYQSYLEHFHHFLPALLNRKKERQVETGKGMSASSSNEPSCQEGKRPPNDSPIPLSYPAKTSMSPLVRSLKIVRHTRKI